GVRWSLPWTGVERQAGGFAAARPKRLLLRQPRSRGSPRGRNDGHHEFDPASTDRPATGRHPRENPDVVASAAGQPTALAVGQPLSPGGGSPGWTEASANRPPAVA